MLKLGLNITSLFSLVVLLAVGFRNQCVWSYQGPQGVRFTHAPSHDNFYAGQKFEFTCEAGTGNGTSYETAIPSNKPTSIYLIFTSKVSGKVKEIGCNYFGEKASVEEGPHIPQWNTLTTDDCGYRDQKLEQITITGNITQAMRSEYSNYSCEAYYKDGDKTIVQPSKNQITTIPELKIAPQNLTLALGDIVKEGKRFNFSCDSVGGKPRSNYTYKLERDSDTVSPVLADPFYVPSSQDREGINISCMDQSHINYPGSKSNIIKWMHVMPQYLEFKDSVGKETSKTVVLDTQTPQSINLSCDVFVSSEGLGHEWSFNGLELKEWEDKITIGLDTSDLKNDDKADCKVGFSDGQTSKQYSWIFKRAEDKQLPWLPIVLGSVAVVLLIVVISLALCCKRKPQARSAPNNAITSGGNFLAKNKLRTQRSENRTGFEAMTPADQSPFYPPNRTPTMMYPSEVTNTLLQQQYNHNRQLRQMEDQRLDQYSRGQPEGQERVFVFHTDEV